MDKEIQLNTEIRMTRYIASVSWGKDSLAMLIKLLEENYPLDEVVFFDTEKEFNAIYDARDSMLPRLEKRGIKYTELKPTKSFDFLMFDTLVNKRDGTHKTGYGWCGGMCRWFTTEKVKTINNYYKRFDSIIEYIGLAYDEPLRLARLKENQKAPLAEWKITEKDALRICYEHGWDFGGLYEILKRVSCWCCRNKNLKELNNYRKCLPEYFDKLVEIEEKLHEPMKKPYYLKERKWKD